MKFLLTDDDADDREMFSEALKEAAPGIECDCSAGCNETLDKLENEHYRKPDLIFLDINMPIASGWDCLKKIKRGGLNNIPVIMYSTSSHERDKLIAKDLGAHGFITKPDDYTKLRSMLKNVVDKVKAKGYPSWNDFEGLHL